MRMNNISANGPVLGKKSEFHLCSLGLVLGCGRKPPEPLRNPSHRERGRMRKLRPEPPSYLAGMAAVPTTVSVFLRRFASRSPVRRSRLARLQRSLAVPRPAPSPKQL